MLDTFYLLYAGYLSSTICWIPSTVCWIPSTICWIHVYLLLYAGYLSSTICWIPSTVCWIPSTVCWIPSTVCWIPSTVCWIPSTVCWIPSTICWISIFYYMLDTFYCMLDTFYYMLDTCVPSTVCWIPSTVCWIPSTVCWIPSTVCWIPFEVWNVCFASFRPSPQSSLMQNVTWQTSLGPNQSSLKSLRAVCNRYISRSPSFLSGTCSALENCSVASSSHILTCTLTSHTIITPYHHPSPHTIITLHHYHHILTPHTITHILTPHTITPLHTCLEQSKSVIFKFQLFRILPARKLDIVIVFQFSIPKFTFSVRFDSLKFKESACKLPYHLFIYLLVAFFCVSCALGSFPTHFVDSCLSLSFQKLHSLFCFVL